MLATSLAVAVAVDSSAQVLTPFNTTTVAPAFDVNGDGSNVDSIAFWEAPDPSDTLMFVTGKSNDRVEVWKFPFVGNELSPILFPSNVNGVVVDQETDLLYVSDRIVSIFPIPALQLADTFGSGTIGVGENNLDILKHANGQTWVYVSDDHNVYRYDAATLQLLGSFAPPVSSIETVLADDFHQVIYVPEEQGPEGNPGVFAYHPDGTEFQMNGSNRFGNNGEFDSDEEGIALYTFPAHGETDDGTGFIVISDQRSDVTDFEVFDRQTWAHLGAFRLTGVSNTDGIASTQRPLPGYPLGIFAAINDDSTTAGMGWDTIFSAIGWDLSPEAVRIAPGTANGGSVDLEVTFSESVTGFNDATDLVINHDGTTHSSVTITGSGNAYTLTVSGLAGIGSFTVAVDTASDIADASSKPLAASVTSPPVLLGTPYQVWAAQRSLTPGSNDGFFDDPDGDGCENIKEFALDSHPLSGTNSGETRVTLALLQGGKHLAFTIPVRTGADFTGNGPLSATIDGIICSIGSSPDLSIFDGTLEELLTPLDAGLPSLGHGWTYHSFRTLFPTSTNARDFIRLSVSPTP